MDEEEKKKKTKIIPATRKDSLKTEVFPHSRGSTLSSELADNGHKSCNFFQFKTRSNSALQPLAGRI